MKLPRPDDPSGKTFEKMCTDIMNRIYQKPDETFQMYGRVGQDQRGIDIYAILDEECVFIQCKDFYYDKNYHIESERKSIYKKFQSQIQSAIPRAVKLYEKISESNLQGELTADQAELLKVYLRSHKLQKLKFIAMTTLDRDVEVQNLLMSYMSNYQQIEIDVWFWDRISEFMQEYPELLKEYYPMITPVAKTEEELQIQEFYYHWQEAKKIRWSMDDMGGSDLAESDEEKFSAWTKKRIHVEPLYEFVNHQLNDKELRDFSKRLMDVQDDLLPYVDAEDHTKGRFKRLSGYYCHFAELRRGRNFFVASPLFVSQIDLWMAKLECEHLSVKTVAPGRYVHIDHAKSCVRRAKESISIVKSKSIRGQGSQVSYMSMTSLGKAMEENSREIDCLEQDIARLEKTINELEFSRKAIEVRVNQPTDPALLFEPVFSSVFDSVRSGKAGNRNLVEMSIMQLAASGKTILLQGPQVVDNLDILSLLAEEKISPLIEKGIITFSPYGNIYTPYDYFNKNIQNPKFDSVTFPFLVGDDDDTRRKRISVLIALERPSKDTRNSMMRALSDFKEEDRKKVETLYQAMQVLNQTLKNEESMKYYQSDANLRLKNFTLANSYTSMIDNGIKVSSLIGYRLTELEKEEEISPHDRAELLHRLRNLDAYMLEKKCHFRSDYYKALKYLEENSIDDLCLLDSKSEPVTVSDLESYRGLVDRAYNVFQGYLSANHLDLVATENEIALEDEYDRINDAPLEVDYCIHNYLEKPIARRTTMDFENIMEMAYDTREIVAENSSMEEIAGRMEHHLGVKVLATQNGCIAITEANYKTSEGVTNGLTNEKSEGAIAFSNENIVNEGIRN